MNMKKCPQCNSIFDISNEYCLHDGTTLVDANMIKEPFPYSSGDTPTVVRSTNDMPTVVTPNFQTPFPTAAKAETTTAMKWVYPVLGLLIGIIVVLGFMVFSSQEKKEVASQTASLVEVEKKEKKEENVNTDTEKQEGIVQEQPQKTIIIEKPAPPTHQTIDGTGRFPEGSTRYLTENDIRGKFSWDLRIMRNEIFARHGYIFKNPALRNYFMSQNWYQPKSRNVTAYLNGVEKRNVKFLKSYE